MFGKLFGAKSSPAKVDDAVRYFFKFSLHLLTREGDGPFNLSESEKYDFRNRYIAETGIENYGVMFFSRIELEATNFTNHHLASKTTFKIGACSDPVIDMNNPTVLEVKNYLSTII